MKSGVIKQILACLFVTVCLTSTLSGANPSCRCLKKPSGPGGGVQCAADQIATCDASTGECNCTCDSVSQGKTKEEYLSVIFSRVSGKKVQASEVDTPKYQSLKSSFQRVQSGNTFFVAGQLPNGQEVDANVSVPDWLKEVLKQKDSEPTPRF